jgi:hypothetical protein
MRARATTTAFSAWPDRSLGVAFHALGDADGVEQRGRLRFGGHGVEQCQGLGLGGHSVEHGGGVLVSHVLSLAQGGDDEDEDGSAYPDEETVKAAAAAARDEADEDLPLGGRYSCIDRSDGNAWEFATRPTVTCGNGTSR